MKDRVYSPYTSYSSDEIEVGKWTDGKTLYKKVVNFSLTTPNTDIQYEFATGVSAIIDISGFISLTSTYIPLNMYVDNSEHILTYADYVNGKGRIRLMYNNSKYNGKEATVIIEYTK